MVINVSKLTNITRNKHDQNTILNDQYSLVNDALQSIYNILSVSYCNELIHSSFSNGQNTRFINFQTFQHDNVLTLPSFSNGQSTAFDLSKSTLIIVMC